ncbi:ribonuclease E/G [Roseovarius salinarum]|uniref:ribonuclease E/G n=1 Tax=Roseovarius salinarum TaxID=1981892 RepID=UPI000C33ACFF|nr:ribonuclease E/G [Roseovarius salinarum]
MKGRLIALDALGGAEAAALVVDGRLEDLFLDAEDRPRPGAIFRAIADRPVKGQGGMFLRTPDGPAFLRRVKGLAPGHAVLVQVSGHAEPGKAIPVTDRLLFKSRYAIITPGAPGVNVSRAIRDETERDRLLEIAHGAFDPAAREDMGLILRSACAGGDTEGITGDIRAMAELSGAVLGDAEGESPEKLTEGDGPHELAWREWTAPAEVDGETGAFARHGVLDALEALGQPVVSLGAGASMAVEPTRALVAVDVNTGGDTSPAAGMKANLAAAKALPRELRLRGLAGQVTIDTAPMPKKDRRRFEEALRGALRTDGVETALAGWTPLGHFELHRKRDRIALCEVMPR